MKLVLFNCLLFFLFAACDSLSEAEKIINRSIDAHGGVLFEKAKISFDFRNRYYEIHKSSDRFEYVREFADSTGLVRDVLNNEGFVRTVNGEEVTLEDKWIRAYTNSVNSVAYFAFLPYGLNDFAVHKSYLGETEISGETYHLIKVTFSEEGGGEDFDDEFLYWINQESYLVDYLAYSYETDGGGVRFRRAVHQHTEGGLVLQDYENYQPKDKNTPLEDMEALYKVGELELLSKIELKNIKVEIIN